MHGGGEGGRTASAQIGSLAHQQQRQSIFLILISRVFSCQPSARPSLRPHCLPEVSRSLRQPSASPPHFHLFFYFLIHPVELGYPQLRQARDCPSGPSLILSQFLEYFMENGDLRAVVRRFLPLRHPNCTHRMRLHADGRDPPLPPALHVSTSHRFGVGGGRHRSGVVDIPGFAGRRSRTGGPRQACTCSGALSLIPRRAVP